jgi:hypothetical protein
VSYQADVEAVRLARQSRGAPARSWAGRIAVRDVLDVILRMGAGDTAVHDDPAAHAAAALLDAPAFCYGGEVFLGSPAPPFGPTLPEVLRHELVHVAQVQNARSTGQIDPPHQAEREAIRLCRDNIAHFEVACGASPDRFYFWNPDGHCIMTQLGLNSALDDLGHKGRLMNVALSSGELGRMMTWMPLNNCTEDIDWGNFSSHVGLGLGDPLGAIADFLVSAFRNSSPVTNYVAHRCAAFIKGDQIKHFMISLDEDPYDAYRNCIRHIKFSSVHAWTHFKEAFHHGFGATLRFEEENELERETAEKIKYSLGVSRHAHGGHRLPDRKSADATRGDHTGHGTGAKIFAVGKSELLPHEYDTAFSKAQHYLGAACHTLQDSFSPAHTLRDFTNEHIILSLYAYDKANQHKSKDQSWEHWCAVPGGPGWLGHEWYDRWIHEQKLAKMAVRATKDLIFTVMDYAINYPKHEHRFTRELDNTLIRHAQFSRG